MISGLSFRTPLSYSVSIGYGPSAMGTKYLLTTFGCKVNQYESQLIREVLENLGLRRVRRGEAPDLAVVNTCAVTVNATRKNRRAIRRLARGGRTPVFVVGCGASADTERLGMIDGVAAVLGHDTDVCAELRTRVINRLGLQQQIHPRKDSFNSQLSADQAHQRPNAQKDKVWMNSGSAMPVHRDSAIQTLPEPIKIISASLPIVKDEDSIVSRIDHFYGHQRAFLKVQDGCDAFCTYCIIPQLRANLRSKPVEVAVEEAQSLVKSGHKEIIITGIFLGAYGRETAIRKRFSSEKSPFVELISALAKVKGLERLRISSLEPGDVDDALLAVLSENKNCVLHLHLPLQSGSGAILRKMNRQYDIDQFFDMVERVRKTLDQPAISTDIIVGFPGESEADFEASVQAAYQSEFCKIHAFPFSPRENTAAARWQKEYIHPTVVRERMQRLAEVERECSLAFRKKFVGQTERVIVERSSEGGDEIFDDPEETIFHGRADRYFQIHFEADQSVHSVQAGDIVSVCIDRVTPTRTHGTIIESTSDTYPLHVLTNQV